jgi:hypothetical protein
MNRNYLPAAETIHHGDTEDTEKDREKIFLTEFTGFTELNNSGKSESTHHRISLCVFLIL